MVNGLWGKKIGMTQVFSKENEVVPVTVIDVSNWYVTQIKTVKTDGYNALQLGQVKKKHASKPFEKDWLRKKKTYFSAFKEVALTDQARAGEEEGTIIGIEIGQAADAILSLSQGDHVDVFGMTIGRGFQGVVKRHGFAGGPASHGATFGRFPGALNFQRACGRVAKGKKMPGHMGVDRVTVKNLEVIEIEPTARIVLVKGSVPGKTGSLLFVRKA